MAKRRREPLATALARYALLEAPGEYWDGDRARPREVVVKFGRASLTLSTYDDVPVTHWALAGLRRVDGPVGETALRLTPDMDGDERLVMRDPAMIEAIRAVCPDLERGPPPDGTWRRVALWGAGAVASVALTAFVIVPALADRLAPWVPEARAAALGDAVLAQLRPVLAGGPDCASPEGSAALSRMTARLAPHAGIEGPLEVSVWPSATANAFAAPGGRVVLFSGLLDLAETPEEAAAVLAHEFGHVAARDPLRAALRRAGTAGLLGLLAGDVLGGAVVVATAEAAVSAAWSREAEAAADAYAHRLMGEAGLPSAALGEIFERLAAQGPEMGGLSRHFASHPDVAARAAAARAADVTGGAAFAPVLDDADWIALQRICE